MQHSRKTVKLRAGGVWSAIVPVLACALCSACSTTYAKLFSALGVGFGPSEFHHLVRLVVAISASIGVSSWRTRRVWSIAIALTGSALVATGRFVGDLHFVEWPGVLLLRNISSCESREALPCSNACANGVRK